MKPYFYIGGLLFLAFCLFIGNLFWGSVSIPASAVWDICLGNEVEKSSWSYIVLQSRFPQAVTAFFAGAALALILTMIGVPALAFALGMFIPLDLNTPLLIGGLVSWYVGTRSKDENVNKARRERGTLIASGFIAGGALMGVISAILKYCGADWFITWSGAEVLAVVMYILIILYFIYDSMKAKLTD